MRFTVLTLFPEAFDSALRASLFGKAREKNLVEVAVIDIRDFAEGRHRVVDDTPFGGGPGMVMKVEPIAAALGSVRKEDPGVHVVLLSPQGLLLTQTRVVELAERSHVVLLCGRYEGVDERVRSLVDEELSIGDYVLAGGEPAAWVIMDAVSRLLPGVLGCGESVQEESFGAAGLLEYPQYTRPRVFGDRQVPEVLLSGNHADIARWRRQQSLVRTALRRPELLGVVSITADERAWLEEELKRSGK